jgi:hypothetical protein
MNAAPVFEMALKQKSAAMSCAKFGLSPCGSGFGFLGQSPEATGADVDFLVLAVYENLSFLDVWLPPALRVPHRVADVVAVHRPFPTYLTFCHRAHPQSHRVTPGANAAGREFQKRLKSYHTVEVNAKYRTQNRSALLEE